MGNILNDIEVIINKTFAALDQAYKTKKEDSKLSCNKSRIVFPKYQDQNEETRVSEQELRCTFIEQLIAGTDFNYSIETPTIDRYAFGKPEELAIPKHYDRDSSKGRSGCIDLALFNKEGQRIAIIEFKKAPCDPHEYAKDFLKLFAEPDDNTLRYFICISKEKHVTPAIDIMNKLNGIDNYKKKGFYNPFKFEIKENGKPRSLYFYSHQLTITGQEKIIFEYNGKVEPKY